MTPRALGMLLLSYLTLRVSPVHADPTATFPPEQRFQVVAEARAGTSTGPYVTEAFPETTAYGTSLALGGRFRWDRRGSLGLRVPLVLARLEQPAGALYAEAAWGNPELSGAFDVFRRDQDDWTLDLTAGVAVGVPLAEHERAQLAGRVLSFADALEGFGEPELFTPGVLPFTPRGRLLLSSRRWRFGASLKLPLLARVTDASLPADSATRALGFVPVAELSARLQLLTWLAVSAAPRLTVRAVSPVDDHAPPLQLLAIGRVELRLGAATSAAVVFQAPVAGALGGSTLAGGVTLRTGF
jgi:hypothetical protein